MATLHGCPSFPCPICQPGVGRYEPPALTEERIRQIIREELAASRKGLVSAEFLRTQLGVPDA